MIVIGNGVTDFRVRNVLQSGEKEADFSGAEFVDRHWLGHLNAHGFYLKILAVGHQTNLLSCAHLSVDDTGEHSDSAIGIEPRIENECLQGSVDVALRRRN